MQTKVYFASSVPAAIEVARQELGEDAMLVGSRPTPPDMRQYGRIEVAFAWNPPEQAPVSEENLQHKPPAFQIDEIRQQLAELRLAVGGKIPPEPRHDNWIAAKLLDCGFSRAMAQEIAAGTAGNMADPETAAVAELTRRIPVAEPTESRMIAVVGPPGRGKTTSLVKIAMNSGISKRIPVRIYTAGAHAIGAREQMARFAAILGTPWQACESLASLDLALNGDPWKGLVLVDTPGIAPAEGNELAELARFFKARTHIERHLVLRADATSADMLHVISRFSVLAPTRLLFTGLDEASSAAPMIETLIRSGIPATFAGTGQQIPDDLTELIPSRAVRSVFAGETAASVADRPRFVLAAA